MPKILIIEDEDSIQVILKMYFESKGFSVAQAADAEACFDYLSQGPVPDAILLDLCLKGMSGANLLEKIRVLPVYESIPVIIITGAVTTLESLPASSMYQAIVGKPFDLKELFLLVSNYIKT